MARAKSSVTKSSDTPIREVLGGELGRAVERLGVTTRAELRERGWKEVLRELVAIEPKRLTQSTALSLCAAEMGKRPIEVGESRLDRIGVFVWSLKAKREEALSHLTPAAAMDAVVEHDVRRRLAEARRYAREHAAPERGKAKRKQKNAP